MKKRIIEAGITLAAGGTAIYFGSLHPVKAEAHSFGAAAQIQSLVPVLLTQATDVDGNQVQADLNAAIASGASSFTLPGARILLTQPLVIPRGTSNFTLRGQNGTRLVRNSFSNFTLLQIGTTYSYAMDNVSMNDLPSTQVGPIAEGTRTLTVSGGAPVTAGSWYFLIGTDPVDDVVTHVNGGQTYWIHRELVQVGSVNGSAVTLKEKVGRSFNACELRQIEAAGALPQNKVICQNVRVENMAIDGIGLLDGSRTNKNLVANCTVGLTINDVSSFGFSSHAMNVQMSRGATINLPRISNGRTDTLGYGVVFSASRFNTVRNGIFRQLRHGVLLECGSMDTLIEDSTVNNDGIGSFDLGHGSDERRTTIRRCSAPVFTIGNPSYRRGSQNVTIENCTAFKSIDIFGNSDNSTITGKNSQYSYTSPMIQFFAEGGGSGVPQGTAYPKNVLIDNAIFSRPDSDGNNIQFLSLTNAGAGVEHLTVRNSTFSNPNPNTGSAVYLRTTSIASNLSFQNCTFQNTYRWGTPLWLGQTTGLLGRWNVEASDCKFVSNYTFGAKIDDAAMGSFVSTRSTINGQPLDSNRILGGSSMLLNLP